MCALYRLGERAGGGKVLVRRQGPLVADWLHALVRKRRRRTAGHGRFMPDKRGPDRTGYAKSTTPSDP